jgi:small subunit ribosomal protein S16
MEGLSAQAAPTGAIPRPPLQLPAYLGTSADWATQELQHMVKIRLTRGGAKKRPFYHIIVTDSRSARDGRNIERLGFYNPVATGGEKRVELNTERVKHWVGLGAQMSDKVADLYKQFAKSSAAGDQPAAAA